MAVQHPARSPARIDHKPKRVNMPTVNNPGYSASHVVVRSLVRSDFEPPAAALVEAIARADATRLRDLVSCMYTMDYTIRTPCGPALPVTGVATRVGWA